MPQRRKPPVPRPPVKPSSPLASAPLGSSSTRLLCSAILLTAGLALAATWYGQFTLGLISLGPWGPTALLGFVAIVFLGLALRPVAPAVSAFGRTIETHARLATGLVVLATFAYLFATALGQGRPLHPYVHDEFSYLIQAHQFARLHGWMPAHPLAPFFDSFQLLDAPVYASAYFPGTALLHVPGIWLGLPPWITSLLVAAIVAGLLFRVVVELLNGPAALAAVLLLWTDGRYRTLSIMTLAQMPLLMWGLAATVAWLKSRSADIADRRGMSVGLPPTAPGSQGSPGGGSSWLPWSLTTAKVAAATDETSGSPKGRPSHRHRWSLAIGACLGMAALTRPVDALCFALPIALDVLLLIAKPNSPGSRSRLRNRLVPLALLLAPVVPCLLFQISLNRGITGHWLETPFRLYADRDYPGTSYGFHPFDPAARPRSPLPQKQALYDEYRPVLADHTLPKAIDNLFRAHATGLSPARIELTLVRLPTLPLPMLLPLVPVALVGLTRRRAVVLAAVPLFLLLYVGYVFFFPHYTLAVAGAIVLAVVVGAEQLPLLLPAVVRPRATAAVPVILIGLAIAGLPQFDAPSSDNLFAAPLIADVDRQLASLGHRPAIVLFTYDPKRNTNEEPVFNADVAWPDDAPILRAHDLGPARNRDLFAYYAARQPARFVYRYDERTQTLRPLGTAAQLIARPER